MVHCDYSAVKFKPITHPKFTKYIGVSQYVCDIFTNLTGIPCELCYNPVYLDKPKVEKKKDKVHIIYAGRLTEEKQGWLIDKFSDVMDKSGIDYDFNIRVRKGKKANIEKVLYYYNETSKSIMRPNIEE